MEGFTKVSPYLIKSTNETAYNSLADQLQYFYILPVGGVPYTDLNLDIKKYLDSVKLDINDELDFEYSYDANGNLITETIYTNTSPRNVIKTIAYTYSNDGTKLMTETFTYSSTVLLKTYYYDNSGRVTMVTVRRQ